MPRKMKDSGIEWIGEIPENWSTVRFKFLHNGLNTGEAIDKEYWSNEETDTVFYTAGLVPIKTNYKDFPRWKYTGGGDLLLARNGTPYVYFPVEGAAYTDHIIRATMKKHINRRFVQYCLQESIMSVVVDSVSIATWSASLWNEQTISMPPDVEQERIVNYLDTKCAKIDAVLEQTRQSIEEYKKLKQAVITQAVTKGIRPGRKMKDSGIEWIGEIPEEWEFSRMKNVAYIVDCKNRTPENLPEGEYTVVRTACIRNGTFTYEGSYKTDETNYRAWTERGAPRKGDVFFTREAPVGEACMVPDDPSLCMGQRVMYFRPFDGIDGRFLMYSVYGSLAQEYIITKNNGSTVGHLKLGQVGELPLLLCSYEEQQQICDYLDVRTKRIELIIAKKEQFLTELQSYKKSLIYECVTGKRKI